uniref:Uncharacterized protein n=1 Tax=Rhizophora mucronata TaxID=61149 RepID=A0A2P2R3Y1_RHIMU
MKCECSLTILTNSMKVKGTTVLIYSFKRTILQHFALYLDT